MPRSFWLVLAPLLLVGCGTPGPTFDPYDGFWRLSADGFPMHCIRSNNRCYQIPERNKEELLQDLCPAVGPPSPGAGG